MNIKYPANPEVIASIRELNNDGDERFLGSKVAGIQVLADEGNGMVQIDLRDYRGSRCLIIEIELPELVAALSCATLNAEREGK